MKVKLYIPDFKLAFDHFCIHAGGRACIDELEENLQLLLRTGSEILHRPLSGTSLTILSPRGGCVKAIVFGRLPSEAGSNATALYGKLFAIPETTECYQLGRPIGINQNKENEARETAQDPVKNRRSIQNA
ncbi:hypothetical protein R1sor_008699 [Riccia sorocarpa]|uniref:Uncharacterized protein n=1 Tax=Riccia sorocarpa TaxID=122646 RepID=A0ABD3HUJ6_9MARC